MQFTVLYSSNDIYERGSVEDERCSSADPPQKCAVPDVPLKHAEFCFTTDI